MPEETTTTEEKPKVYEEAYVKGLRTESQKHREEKESIAKERDELKKLIDERTKKELEEQGKLKEALDMERAERAKEKAERDKERAEAQRERLLTKAEAKAIKRGIRDEALEDLALLKWDDVTLETLDAKLDEIATARPHWFKASDPEKKRSVTTPDRKDGSSSGTSHDYGKVSDAEFKAKLAEMGVTNY